jgi:hypothetical protein
MRARTANDRYGSRCSRFYPHPGNGWFRSLADTCADATTAHGRLMLTGPSSLSDLSSGRDILAPIWQIAHEHYRWGFVRKLYFKNFGFLAKSDRLLVALHGRCSGWVPAANPAGLLPDPMPSFFRWRPGPRHGYVR